VFKSLGNDNLCAEIENIKAYTGYIVPEEYKLVCTDPDTNQWRRKTGEGKYYFRENRINNPETKETYIYEDEINLSEYDEKRIKSDLNTFGYFGYDEEEVMKGIKRKQEEFSQLAAEAIFELSN
jgi:hypothetical protein